MEGVAPEVTVSEADAECIVLGLEMADGSEAAIHDFSLAKVG